MAGPRNLAAPAGRPYKSICLKKNARSPAHRALAREAAAASFVLLRNERARLPLSSRARRIALIGNDATEARVGGYSPPGARAVSIAEGIRAALPAGSVLRVSDGVPRIWKPLVVIPAAQFSSTREGSTVTGLQGEYWPNISFDGAPTITRTDAQIDAAFDTITYGKGGHVVAMIAAFMGDEKFRDGVRAYFALYLLNQCTQPQTDAGRDALLARMAAMEQADWGELLTRYGRTARGYAHRLAGRPDDYLAFCRDELARCRHLGAASTRRPDAARPAPCREETPGARMTAARRCHFGHRRRRRNPRPIRHREP